MATFTNFRPKSGDVYLLFGGKMALIWIINVVISFLCKLAIVLILKRKIFSSKIFVKS
jgi:hypothetical protein